jgi:hypothetical protein
VAQRQRRTFRKQKVVTAMKCKKLFIFLAALIAVAAVGTTLAFMLKKTLVDN